MWSVLEPLELQRGSSWRREPSPGWELRWDEVPADGGEVMGQLLTGAAALLPPPLVPSFLFLCPPSSSSPALLSPLLLSFLLLCSSAFAVSQPPPALMSEPRCSTRHRYESRRGTKEEGKQRKDKNCRLGWYKSDGSFDFQGLPRKKQPVLGKQFQNQLLFSKVIWHPLLNAAWAHPAAVRPTVGFCWPLGCLCSMFSFFVSHFCLISDPLLQQSQAKLP